MSSVKDQFLETKKKYINQERAKRLAGLGGFASASIATLGAYKNKPKVYLPALAASGISGYLHNKYKKKSKGSLKKLRGYYELKKEGMIGGLLHGVVSTATLGAKGWIPFGLDIAATPGLAAAAEKKFWNVAHTTAKKNLGHELTKAEQASYKWGNFIKSIADLTEVEKGTPLNPLNPKTYAAKQWKGITNNPVVNMPKYIANFYAGIASKGAKVGEKAAPIINEVNKISPRYGDLLLNALKGGENQEHLISALKKDHNAIQKSIDDSKGTLLAKILKKGLLGAGEAVKGVDPEKIPEMINKYVKVEQGVIRGAKAMGASLGVFGLAHAIPTNEFIPKKLFVEPKIKGELKVASKQKLVGTYSPTKPPRQQLGVPKTKASPL